MHSESAAFCKEPPYQCKAGANHLYQALQQFVINRCATHTRCRRYTTGTASMLVITAKAAQSMLPSEQLLSY